MKISAKLVIALLACGMLLIAGQVAQAQKERSKQKPQEPAHFSQIPESQVNPEQKSKAQQIAETLLKNWEEKKFEPLSEVFAEDMRKGFTPKMQKEAAESIKKHLGQYKSMTFAQAMISPNQPGIVVYRFKGQFTNPKEVPEIYVIMTSEGNVADFGVQPWEEAPQKPE
jgi:hypothetical protein